MVGRDHFLGFGIQEQTRHIVAAGSVLILATSEDLVDIARMEGILVILLLEGVPVVFCIDNHRLISLAWDNVGLYHRKEADHWVFFLAKVPFTCAARASESSGCSCW